MADDQQYPAPSAPPRQGIVPAPPPSYDAVLEHDEHRAGPGARIANTLTSSMAIAGRSIGRFFNVHDDRELEGWQRAGTLPRNRYAVGYSPIAAQGDEPSASEMPLGNRQQQQQERQQGEERSRPQRGKNRMQRVTDTLSSAIPGRKREPTRDEVMKSLPKFWPVVTVLIGLLEVSMLVAVIVTGGLAPIKFVPQEEFKTVVGFDNRSISASRQIVPNFFIGTSKAALVHAGGMYTPCMRENVGFRVQAAKDRLEEENLRCCLSDTYNQCGMLPQEICQSEEYGGQVLGGASSCRAELNNTDRCEGGITLHPCCVGLLGQCIITTYANCTFQDGVWHPDQLLCGEVGAGCFDDICKFTNLWIDSIPQPNQGLRFVSSMFLYDGAITLLIIGLLKFYNSWSIEKRIGFLRVICIYILSGIGGFLFSGIFDPTNVSVGGSGALFGMLGVLVVELLQGWKWVKKPCVELIKLIVMIIVALMLGTLPYIDNFSQIGGFIFGVLASFIFVPYIILGKWDRAKKLCLILTAVPIILVLFFVGFVVFYNMSDPNFCPYCSYINCIPYTATFCDDFILTLLSISPV